MDTDALTTRDGFALDLLGPEDVIGALASFHANGLRLALVTVAGIEGAAPRPLGAQMVVAEDGRYSGYLSGGCLEQSVAAEAVAAIQEGHNRTIRFGKESRYFDIKLPCGSGLELYVDQTLPPSLIETAARLRAGRTAFHMAIDTSGGGLAAIENTSTAYPRTSRAGAVLYRAYTPRVRVLVAGSGPAVEPIAVLARAAGFEVRAVTPDEALAARLDRGSIETRHLRSAGDLDVGWLDPYTAAVLAFHEHDWEAPLLERILQTPCFYVGALGSRAAHATRLDQASRLGVPSGDLERVRGPIGLIPGAKSRVTLAAGVLAELVAEAKVAGLMD